MLQRIGGLYRLFTLFILFIAITFTPGCATMDSMGDKEGKGAIAGIAGGCLVGLLACNAIKNNAKRIACVVALCVAGEEIGRRIGESFDERDKRLAAIALKNRIEIKTQTYMTVKKGEEEAFKEQTSRLPSGVQHRAYQDKTVYKSTVEFEAGSAKPSRAAVRVYEQIADAYRQDGIRKVIITGHSDSSGPAEYNQKLSEARSRSVAAIFVRKGFPSWNIYYQGVGESEPIASNATRMGRAKNRRVEIVDAADVSGLAMYKRKSAQESQQVINGQKRKKVQAEKPKMPTWPVAVNSLLPFNGSPYENVQPLLPTGTLIVDSGRKSLMDRLSGSLITQAHASEVQAIPAFLNDDVAYSGMIKRMDGKDIDIYSPSDYMAGYFKQPLYAHVGNGLFSIYPVSILKSGWPVEQQPGMSIYKNYENARSSKDDVIEGTTATYIFGDQVLYRWKSSKASVKRSGFLGIDVLLPNFGKDAFIKTHTEQLAAHVYYLQRGVPYVAKIPVNVKLIKGTKIEWRV